MHVGQYSEGEFVAPSGIMGNMTTLHEIPDDIFDYFNTSSKINQYYTNMDSRDLVVYVTISSCLLQMDLFPNEQNFYLDKSRQTFHHSLKEHHKISNIPTFRCEML